MTVPFKKIAESLSEVLPVDLADDLKKNVRAMVQSSLGKMDLVTREELEVQEKVLARTRSQLESLQQRVAELEDALKRSAERSPRGRHKVTAGDADCEHWTDNPVGAAVPGAWTLRWTRAAVLTRDRSAAEAAKRRGTLFIALPGPGKGGGRTGAPL